MVVVMTMITANNIKIMIVNVSKTRIVIIIQNANATTTTIAGANKQIRAFACADFSTVLGAGKNTKNGSQV